MTRKKACDSCHKKKIQCDGAVPRCNWCEHRQLRCTYTRVNAPKKKKQPGARTKRNVYLGELEQRLETLEQSIKAAVAQDGSPAQGGTSSTGLSPAKNANDQSLAAFDAFESEGPTPVFFGRLLFAGFDLGRIVSNNGIPLFSPEGKAWISDRTDDRAPFQLSENPDADTIVQSPITRESVTFASVPNMPSKEEVEDLVESYAGSPIRNVFPVLDRVIMQHTINIAFSPDPEPETPYHASAKACVFAFLSIIPGFKEEMNFSPSIYKIDRDACAAKALHLTVASLPTSSIYLLEASCMLCLYYAFGGHWQLASFCQTVACRLMFVRGGHLNTPPIVDDSISPEEDVRWRLQVHDRHLFWLCYAFDKDISLRTGLPPSIDDDQCDLTLPPKYSGFMYHVAPIDEMTKLETSLNMAFPGDLKIAVIKSRVHKLLYSVSGTRKPDSILLRDVRELDEELENWRQSVPAEFRPLMRITEDTIVHVEGNNIHTQMKAIVTSLEYYYLVGMIHAACGRCRAWGNLDSMERAGVQSSLQLHLAASRSELFYLRVIHNKVPESAFWMLSFYPMMAAVTIFCNLLFDPLSPQAKADVALLDTVPELIRGIRVLQVTAKQAAYFKNVDYFAAELTRLGNRSIIKALGEAHS